VESESIALANLETFRVYYPTLFKAPNHDPDEPLLPDLMRDLFSSAAREMKIRASFEGCYLLALCVEAGLLPPNIHSYGELVFSSTDFRSADQLAEVRFAGKTALRPLLLRLADRLEGAEVPPSPVLAVSAYYLHQRLVQFRVLSQQPGVPELLVALAGGETLVSTSIFNTEPQRAGLREFHLTRDLLRDSIAALLLESPDAGGGIPLDVIVGLLEALADVRDLLRLSHEMPRVRVYDGEAEEAVAGALEVARFVNPDTWRNLVRWSVFESSEQLIADSLGAIDVELEQLSRRQPFLDRRSSIRRDNLG
jgi:hypothetical protein